MRQSHPSDVLSLSHRISQLEDRCLITLSSLNSYCTSHSDTNCYVVLHLPLLNITARHTVIITHSRAHPCNLSKSLLHACRTEFSNEGIRAPYPEHQQSQTSMQDASEDRTVNNTICLQPTQGAWSAGFLGRISYHNQGH